MTQNHPTTLAVKKLRTGASRILLPTGEICGYVYPAHDDSGDYFRACLHQPGTAHNRDIGDFSRFEDALESISRVF